MGKIVDYEIFIVPFARGVFRTVWTWHGKDEAGEIIVGGERHDSLQSCFATVRQHRGPSGDAPIMVKLNSDGMSTTAVAETIDVLPPVPAKRAQG